MMASAVFKGYRRAVLAGGVVGAFALSGHAGSITGKVTNPYNEGIKGAIVSIPSLSVADTTDSLGRYQLTTPSVAVRQSLRECGLNNSLIVSAHSINVVLDKAAPLRLELFMASGERILRIRRELLLPGTHSFEMAAAMQPMQIYIIKASVGPETITGTCLPGLKNKFTIAAGHQAPFPKQAVGNDSLKVSHTDCVPFTKAIAAVSQVINVQLDYDWAKVCTPQINYVREDLTAKGAIYATATDNDPSAHALAVARNVCRILYRYPAKVREAPLTTKINLYIRDYDGVAAKWGAPPEISVSVSTRWLNDFVNANGMAKMSNEITGMLTHEFTHGYQYDGHGMADNDLVEGVADAVRHYAGYNPWSNAVEGGEWHGAYGISAFFFVWLQENKDSVFLYDLNQSFNQYDNISWSENWFFTKFGKTVQALWDEYQLDYFIGVPCSDGTPDSNYCSIRNQWQNVFLQDTGGSYATYRTHDNTCATHWKIITVSTNTIAFKNRATGNFMAAEQNGDHVAMITTDPAANTAAQWSRETVDTTYSVIVNKKYPANFIVIENMKGYAQQMSGDKGWWSAHWAIVKK
jgi:hypothetical protein